MREKDLVRAAFVSTVVILGGVLMEASQDVQRDVPTFDNNQDRVAAVPKDDLANFSKPKELRKV